MRTEDRVRTSLRLRADRVIPREDAWAELQRRASSTGGHAGPSPYGRLAAALVALVVAVAGIGFAVHAFRTTGAIQPASTVRNGKIAFASDGISVVNPDGTGLQKLYQSPSRGFDTMPVWSPDGARLAFAHAEAGGEYELRILDPASGSVVDPRGEEVDAAYSHTWSPDGTRIAFVSGNDLFLIKSDGTGLTQLVGGGSPTWSPDGTGIAFQSGSDVYAVNVDGSGQTKLASNGFLPAWSPSGTKIAFVSNAGQISVVNADGTGLTQLTDIPSEDMGRPAWAPDGSRIAFEAFQGDNYDIYVVNADGTGFRNLTGEAGDENIPTWSPDGTKIAFIAGEAVSENPGNTGTFDVYVMDSDGTNKTRLTKGTAPAYVLSWQPIPSDSGPPAPDPSAQQSPPAAVPIHVEPRIAAEIPLDANPSAISAGESGVWVSVPAQDSSSSSTLIQIDPHTNEIASAVRVDATVESLAVTGNAIWAAGSTDGPGPVLLRLDPLTTRVVATIEGVGVPLVAEDSAAWGTVATGNDHVSLVRIDSTSNEVTDTIPLEHDAYDLTMDGGDVWALLIDTSDDAKGNQGHLVHIDSEMRQVVADIQLDVSFIMLAGGDGNVWVPGVAGQGSAAVRIDGKESAVIGSPIPVQSTFRPFGVGHEGVWFIAGPQSETAGTGVCHLRYQTGTVDSCIDSGSVADPLRNAAIVDSSAGAIWVANRDQSVTRIDVS